jgi:hypothetical protein
MKKFTSVAMMIAAAALITTPVMAAKSYQVTGTVVAVTDKNITVDKSGENFEIAHDASTSKTGANPKVGDKVTIQYYMTARTIENRGPSASAATGSDVQKMKQSGATVTERTARGGEAAMEKTGEVTGKVVGGTVRATGNVVRKTGEVVGDTTREILGTNKPANQ